MSNSERIHPDRKIGPLSPPFLGATPENLMQVREILLQRPEGQIDINRETGHIWVNGNHHRFMTPENNRTFQIFMSIIDAGGLPVLRDDLSELMTSMSLKTELPSLISRLRAKLEPEPKRPTLIQTVRNEREQIIGYALGDFGVNFVDGNRT